MITLHIELQDGWAGQPVEVRLDGALLAELRPSTRYQIGLAHSLESEVEPGEHLLEIIADGVSAHEDLTTDAETWVGVSLGADGMIVRVQPAPFGYA